MQIPFNQVELHPCCIKSMFLFVQCVAVSAYLSGIAVTKKKRHRIKDFLPC